MPRILAFLIAVILSYSAFAQEPIVKRNVNLCGGRP